MKKICFSIICASFLQVWAYQAPLSHYNSFHTMAYSQYNPTSSLDLESIHITHDISNLALAQSTTQQTTRDEQDSCDTNQNPNGSKVEIRGDSLVVLDSSCQTHSNSLLSNLKKDSKTSTISTKH